MANPWEKYAQQAPSQPSGPWAKYGGQTEKPRENVVATTPDGGRVVRMESGNLAFSSPGYSTTDQEAIARIMEGATPAAESMASFDRQTIAQAPVAARVQEVNQGFPLIGEWADEAVGLVSPRAQQGMNALSNAMERQHPVQSAALNITGGVAGAVPLALAGAGSGAANFVGRAGSGIGRVARVGAIGAGAGAVEGAAAFSGRDTENRMRGAATGAAIGGAFGAVLAPVADAMGVGAAALAKRVKRLDVRTIADEFGLSPEAARTVKAALINDDLSAAAARLAQLGDDAMLADAGPATGALLDAASKTGGRALAVTREAVEGRAQTMGRRLPGTLDNILGTSAQGVKTSARNISARTSALRRSAYDRAYSAAIDYSADAGRNIEATLAKVPGGVLRQAINEANEEMQSLGLRNMQIMADIADDGIVTFREMPNVRQLDELKKALGNQAKAAVDQFGRPTSQGLRYKRLAGELRDAVGEAVPSYRTALRLGGDKLQEDAGLDLGRSILFRNASVEDVRAFMASKPSVEARQAVAQGMREAIESTMSNVRRTITDPNVDAREAMQLVKELSSRANVSKVRMVLGQAKADQLFTELDKQASALALRGAVARGSDTAIRQSIQSQATAEATPGVLRRTLGNMGNPLEAAREVTQELAGIDPRSLSEAQRGYFAEIADALTRIRGQEAERALVSVNRALQGQPLKDEEARLIGRAVATAVFQLRQSERQLQAPQ